MKLLLPILVGCLFMAGLVALAVWLIRNALNIYRPFDAPFSRLGFSHASHGLFGRRYDGVYKGRRVRVVFPPRQRSRPRFDMAMDAAASFGLAVGKSRPLLVSSGMARRSEGRVRGPEGEEEAMGIWCAAPDQALRYLEDGDVWAVVEGLMTDSPVQDEPSRELYIGPTATRFRRVPPGATWYVIGTITDEQLAWWLDCLHFLAERAEGMN